MGLTQKLIKARRKLSTDGIAGTMRWVIASLFYYPVIRWIDLRFDRRYGTETSLSVDPRTFDIDAKLRPHVNEYSATPDRLFLRFVREQKIDYSAYTFVDLGCGKGRAVLLASLFPFKNVIGVELEPRIHAICMRNVEIFAKTSKMRVTPTILCMSAGDFEFPASNILLYLFNPFDGHVMAQVAAKLAKAIHAASGAVRIIYFHPNHDAALMALPNVRVIRQELFRDRKSLNDIGRVTVYDIPSRATAVR